MFFSVGALYGAVDLPLDAYRRKGLKRGIPIPAVIPDRLKQSDHPFLDQVIGISSNKIHGSGLFSDQPFVFFHKIV
ncbi:hypothetical protein EVA_09092 [gut metagenome]|uniref:Uncharacterized protein n=1 Tax=gut metagenome TaxID=749906 RepID=J9GKY2_9ZZZZ